jgi:hypothetical protein
MNQTRRAILATGGLAVGGMVGSFLFRKELGENAALFTSTAAR